MVLAYAARSQVKTSVRIGTASLPLGIWSASYSTVLDLVPVQAGCGINAFQVVSKFEYFSHADLLSKKYFWLRNNQKLPVIGLDAKLSCRQDETAAR